MPDGYSPDEVRQEARRQRGHCRWCGILHLNAADWAGSVRCAAQANEDGYRSCEPTDADLEAARGRLEQLAADVDETLRST